MSYDAFFAVEPVHVTLTFWPWVTTCAATVAVPQESIFHYLDYATIIHSSADNTNAPRHVMSKLITCCHPMIQHWIFHKSYPTITVNRCKSMTTAA